MPQHLLGAEPAASETQPVGEHGAAPPVAAGSLSGVKVSPQDRLDECKLNMSFLFEATI